MRSGNEKVWDKNTQGKYNSSDKFTRYANILG